MKLIEGSTAVLSDAKLYLQKISATEYSTQIPMVFNTSIGSHTRHFIEFYQCLIAQAKSETINYSLRQRDLSIETEPLVALNAINEIINNLENLDLEALIVLHTSKEEAVAIKSTIGRELHYNIEHCIHHLALIKVSLNMVCPDMELPDHFGFAPSTIQHRKLEIQQ